MATTIEFSAGMMAGLPGRIFRYGENVGTSHVAAITGLLMSGGDSYGSPGARMTLMKGAVPALSSLTSYTSRNADVLVEFVVRSGQMAPTQPTVNPSVISTTYADATQAGTATWFWWTVRPVYIGDSPNNIIHQIVGTVGLPGSGADLIMQNTNIDVGSPYRILNLRISYQSTWITP